MDADRFDIAGCDRTMMAVVTTGNGGYEMLDYREVPVPVPGPGEVLLQVLAAGVNNTEINTRLGWYSSSVTDSTDSTADVQEKDAEQKADGGWNEATPFPFIQGTDCCGRVEELGRRCRRRRSRWARAFWCAPACAPTVTTRWTMSGWRPTSTAPLPST